MNNSVERITKEQLDIQYGYMDKVLEFTRAFEIENNRKLKVFMLTFGCQQNEADSESICGMAVRMGYTVTSSQEDADLVIINTCAIREHAELKALSLTGQFKHLKEKNPVLKIGICGCMVTQEHRMQDIKNKYPYVDFLFGTNMVYRFPEILYNGFTKNKRQFYFNDGASNICEGLPIQREHPYKAWVSIMYGCNNFCTYCIVPYVRGRERSRLPEDILKEVEDVVKKGYTEITLLGQNVNSYGKDLERGYDFSDLLSDICKIKGEFRIRFMTSHPKDASIKLLETMAREEKIAKHLHLPIQSGNNRILKEMNRRYTKESFLSLVNKAKELMPDIGMTSDIIVGFPSETEEEFEDTLDVLRKAKFDSVFSFIYSPRKGTPASEMKEQIPEKIKKARFNRLLETQNAISKTINVCCEGQIVRVIVEGKSKSDETKYTGRTEQNRLVHFDCDDSKIGKFVNIKISHADTFAMYGEIVD